MNILLLGSKSKARQKLLKDVQLSFVLIDQDSDEASCDWGLPLQQLVEQIAVKKMEHVILPKGQEGQQCFVLTADTLSCDMQGVIHGKPINREDAIAKIKAIRNGVRTGTAFCLDKKIYRYGTWELEKRIVRFVDAEYSFNVPDKWIDIYLEKSYSFISSGAIAVEEFGDQFLQRLTGSYTAIVGLPMYELREALEELGFFSF